MTSIARSAGVLDSRSTSSSSTLNSRQPCNTPAGTPWCATRWMLQGTFVTTKEMTSKVRCHSSLSKDDPVLLLIRLLLVPSPQLLRSRELSFTSRVPLPEVRVLREQAGNGTKRRSKVRLLVDASIWIPSDLTNSLLLLRSPQATRFAHGLPQRTPCSKTKGQDRRCLHRRHQSS